MVHLPRTMHQSCHKSPCNSRKDQYAHASLIAMPTAQVATSTCDLTPTTLSPPTIQTGHGWWCQLMGRWVSWPIKGGLATSIFWKSGTVCWPRSLLNPDELTLLKLPHSVGQPIWSSIQWTINPCSMGWLKSFKQCRSALAKTWLGSVEIIPWVVDHCQPECRWDRLKSSLFTKLPPFNITCIFFLWSPARVLHGPGLAPWILPVIFAKTVH